MGKLYVGGKKKKQPGKRYRPGGRNRFLTPGILAAGVVCVAVVAVAVLFAAGVLRLPEKGAFTKVYALKMMQKI